MAGPFYIPLPGTAQGVVGRTEQVAAYAADFDKKYPGKGAGAAYTAFANANTKLSAQQAAQGFALQIAARGLDAAIAAAVGTAGAATGQIAQGSVTGLSQTAQALQPFLGPFAAVGNFFNALGQAHTWVRIAEAVFGLVLISIGVAKLTHAVPIATKVAKAAGAGALL